MRTPRTYWFALKVFYRKTPVIQEAFERAGWETFLPEQVPSILFVRCPVAFLKEYKSSNQDKFLYYTAAGSREPGKIDEHEMEIFVMVCSNKDPHVTFGGPDKPKYHVGDKVRVTGGPFKGYEGHIQRVGKEKCLCVTLTGLFVMFVSHIHPSLLEKI